MKTKKIAFKITLATLSILAVLIFSYRLVQNQQSEKAIHQILTTVNLQNRFILSQPDSIKYVVPGILLSSPLNMPMLSCFEGKGHECKKLGDKEISFPHPLFDQAARFTAKGKVCEANSSDCAVERSATFKLECSTESRCEKIQITALTQTLNGALQTKKISKYFDAQAALTISKVATKNSSRKAIADQKSQANQLRSLFSKRPHTSIVPHPMPADAMSSIQKSVSSQPEKAPAEQSKTQAR